MENCRLKWFVILENSIWKPGHKGEGGREKGRERERGDLGDIRPSGLFYHFTAASCFFSLTLSMKGNWLRFREGMTIS